MHTQGDKEVDARLDAAKGNYFAWPTERA